MYLPTSSILLTSVFPLHSTLIPTSLPTTSAIIILPVLPIFILPSPPELAMMHIPAVTALSSILVTRGFSPISPISSKTSTPTHSLTSPCAFHPSTSCRKPTMPLFSCILLILFQTSLTALPREDEDGAKERDITFTDAKPGMGLPFLFFPMDCSSSHLTPATSYPPPSLMTTTQIGTSLSLMHGGTLFCSCVPYFLPVLLIAFMMNVLTPSIKLSPSLIPPAPERCIVPATAPIIRGVREYTTSRPSLSFFFMFITPCDELGSESVALRDDCMTERWRSPIVRVVDIDTMGEWAERDGGSTVVVQRWM
mmetsp:Transcript_3192/g.6461  ORF Transcript_3192/g.6461 Transcript_3192/m.6461 type:complete len:309 (-) Transcript_3192:628-1554(-)